MPARGENVEVEAHGGRLRIALPYSVLGAIIGGLITFGVGSAKSEQQASPQRGDRVPEVWAHRLSERERVDADLERRMRDVERTLDTRLSVLEANTIAIARKFGVEVIEPPKGGR